VQRNRGALWCLRRLDGHYCTVAQLAAAGGLDSPLRLNEHHQVAHLLLKILQDRQAINS
jgi:hypothetical protein